MKNTTDYAAEGIEISARVRDAGEMAQYVRGHSQWVKIVREQKFKQWFIARGWNSSLKAHDVSRHPFFTVPTWDDAIERAAQKILDHK